MPEYISPQKASELLIQSLRPVSRVERVALALAPGRILAADIKAPAPWPPYRRAAMDGYAFRAAETPGTLHVAGTLYAGEDWTAPVKLGEALRIMTGAPVPDELDTVLEQEAVQDGANIAVLRHIAPQRNIMPQGHEYRPGDTVLKSGEPLHPLAIGQAASMGLTDVPVFVKPRVLVAVTGNEVVPGGRPLPRAHIYDASGPMLQALLAAMGVDARLRYVSDSPRKLEQMLERAAESFDLVITTGGVSVGRRDYLPELLASKFQRLFWHVDMHPGKAMAAGLIKGTVPVLSLSGNPGAALTAWYLVAAPVAAALGRTRYELPPVPGELLAPFPKSTRETRYLKARFVEHNGTIGFDLGPNQSSDALRSFAEADGLVMIPSESPPQPQGQRLIALRLPHSR
jgi:molybdopterin molybdotransferase